jgi:hypothetical protein
MTSSLKAAAAFGGIGNALSQLVPYLLQRRMMEEQRQREAEGAQALAGLLPFILGDMGGSQAPSQAPGGAVTGERVAGEEAFRKVRPYTEALSPFDDPAKEAEFQRWFRNIVREKKEKFGFDLNPNPDDPRHFYDYRRAFLSGAGMDESGHGTSEFKLAGSPERYKEGIDTITGEPVATGGTRALSPEVQALLPGLTQAASRVKTEEGMRALLGLAQGIRGERRAVEEEERKFGREKELRSYESGLRRTEEAEQQTLMGRREMATTRARAQEKAAEETAKRAREEQETSLKAFGKGLGLGFPAETVGPAVSQLGGTAALSLAETLEGRRKGVAGARQVRPEEVQANIVGLKSAAPILRNFGIKIDEKDIPTLAQNSDIAERMVQAATNFQILGAPEKRKAQAFNAWMKIQDRAIDIALKGDEFDKQAALLFRQFFLAESQRKDIVGKPIHEDPLAVVPVAKNVAAKFREALAAQPVGVKKSGEILATMLDRFNAQYGDEFGETPVRTIPMPQTLKAKGASQDVWDAVIEEGTKAGLGIPDIIQRMAGPWHLTEDEVNALQLELMLTGAASRPGG